MGLHVVLPCCLLVLGVALAQPVEQTVLSGQQIADAVAVWDKNGGSMTLVWGTPYISVQNASFRDVTGAPDGPQPFTTGQLTLKGIDNSTQNSVLDGGMRVGLIPLQGSQLTLDQVSVINQCEIAKLESAALGPESLVVGSSLGTSLWTVNQMIQLVFCKRCVLYVREAELNRQLYMKTMPRVTFPLIQSTLVPLLGNYPPRLLVLSYIRPHEVLAKDMRGTGGVLTNAVVMSINHPTDPVLQWMRARGLLMVPSFCNGTQLPPQLINAKISPEAPAWVPANTSEFVSALREAAQFSARRGVTWAPPELILSSNVSLPASAGPVPTFETHVLITGPFNDDPDHHITVYLDLQRTSSRLRLGPGAQLFIQQLVLTGLAQTPLPTSPTISSALPLAAVTPPPSTAPTADAPHVWLHNVTLELPAEDYLAVAAVVLASTPDDISRCLDADLTARAAQLQPGIQSFTTGAVSPDNQWLHLPAFLGWGINATELRLVPSTPVPQFGSCKGPGATSKRCGHLSCSQLAGVILGSVLGSLALIAAVLLLTRWAGRHKAAACNGGCDDPMQSTDTSIVQMTKAAELSSKATEADHPTNASCPSDTIASRISQLVGTTSVHQFSQTPSDGSTPVCQDPRQLVEQAAQQLGPEANEVKITGVLGTGSYGHVDQGVWRGLNVAVKTMVFEEEEEDKQQEGSGKASKASKQTRAIMEAAIAVSVGHRNLVCTYFHDIKLIGEASAEDAGGLQVVLARSASGQPVVSQPPRVYKLFLVQEYCHITLAKAVADRLLSTISDVTTQQAVVNILRDVACGLDYLHKNSIVHGDLKPENILLKVEPERNMVVAKLADFGLSTHLSGNATHVSNLHCGTPFYVAPEVIKLGRMSRSADVFSFGVIMWQCFTGCTPFICVGKGDFRWHPAFPKLIGPTCLLTRKAQPLMVKCMNTIAADRPSAAEVVAQLDEILQSLGH